jgi:hypothetical protein
MIAVSAHISLQLMDQVALESGQFVGRVANI